MILRDEKKINFPDIKRIWIKFYLIYQNNNPKKIIKQIRDHLDRKYKIGFVSYKGTIVINVYQRKVFTGIFPDWESIEIQNALNQVFHSKKEGEKIPTIWRGTSEILKNKAFKQIKEFWHSWYFMLINPSLSAKRLAFDRFDATEPFKFYFISFAFSSILAYIFESKLFHIKYMIEFIKNSFEIREYYFLGMDLLNLPSVPIIGDLFNLIFFIIFLALPAAIYAHVLLKIVKGKGYLRHAFFANLYTMGITLPIITLIDGIATNFNFSQELIDSLGKWGYPILSIGYASTFLSISYKLKPLKVYLLLAFVPWILMLFIFWIILPLFY